MGLRGQQASRLHFVFWNDKEKAGKSLRGVLTQNARVTLFPSRQYREGLWLRGPLQQNSWEQ